MKLKILIFIIFLAWKVECNPITKIHDLQFNGNFSEIIFKTRVHIAKYSSYVFSLNETSYSYEFAIMQAHCHHLQISMSLDVSQNGSITQYGTNIAFLLKADDSEKIFKLTNDNNEDVQCMVAIIAYPKSSPMPGNCVVQTNSTSFEMIELIEDPNLLTAVVPSVDSTACNDSDLAYETYYMYLPMMEFSADVYFEGIERMLYDGVTTTYQTKHVPIHNKHIFEKIPGRAIIINTVIKGKNGKMTYFAPVATYSCPSNTWLTDCTEKNLVKRGFSIVLIIFSIVMIYNCMAPEFIESILNGMLFGGFLTILFIQSFTIGLQGFDYFITVIVGSFFVSSLFGFITIYVAIGRNLSKFTLSLFLVLFIMEIFFDTITSAYLEVIIAMILAIILTFIPITCAVFLGCLLFILNISFLLKFSNLHRFMINNFLALTTLPGESINESYFDFIRPNYINYKVSLNYADQVMMFIYFVMSIVFTIRKEQFFFWHPEALEGSFIGGEYERMVDERMNDDQNERTRANEEQFANQFDTSQIERYVPKKGCKPVKLPVKLVPFAKRFGYVRYPFNRSAVVPVNNPEVNDNQSNRNHTCPARKHCPIHCKCFTRVKKLADPEKAEMAENLEVRKKSKKPVKPNISNYSSTSSSSDSSESLDVFVDPENPENHDNCIGFQPENDQVEFQGSKSI